MDELTKFYIENVRFLDEVLTEYGAYFSASENYLVKCFKTKYINEKDIKLLNLIFDKNPTQKKFDKFISEWDIEVEGAHKALMLAHFMHLHPELKYPKYIEPRLKGVVQFFRFYNLKYISHFKKVAQVLREERINVLIIKGGAIRYYRGDFPRAMGDIDIIVPKDNYYMARDIVLELGYKFYEREHSIDLFEPGTNIDVLDLHRKVDFISIEDNDYSIDLFKRARPRKVFGERRIFVPCIEDLVFIILTNFMKNLHPKINPACLLHNIWDCEYLISLKPDFDWNIIQQNAIKHHVEILIYVATVIFHEFIQDKMPVFCEEEFIKAYNELYSN